MANVPRMRIFNRTLLPCATLALAGCSFHSTATHWHGRVGPDGTPIHVKVTTNVGFNLLVVLPFLGNTTIDTMLDVTSAEIADKGSDRLRVIQTGSENYWYGFPPVTWILTPVITDVAIEYQPSAQELADTAALHRLHAERAEARREQDNRHVIPEARR